jgi:PAS domain S-box-containing protein
MKPAHLSAMVTDMTEHRRAEEFLRSMSRVFQEAADPIVIEDLEGRVIDANDEAVRAYGWSRDELIGQQIKILVPPERHAQADELLARCKREESVRNVEGLRTTKDGRVHSVLITLTLLTDNQGEPVSIATLTKDISDLKKAEEALRERTTELEKLNEDLRNEIEKRKKFEVDLRLKGEKILQEQNRRKYLSDKLIETLERERQEIAGTLHDEVGQILTTINMDLDFVKQLASEHADTVVDEIEKAQHRIRKSMDYISDLSRDLRPHILDDLGLVHTLRNMFHKIKERSHIGCHLFTKDIPEQLSKKKAVAVYRIVQEAVRNCLRHARAKNIFVNLIRRDHFILLTIEDDGIGFEYDNVTVEKGGREKLGIMIMNERAVQVDGEFRIESSPGKGTQVIVEIPIE